jgi:hypothetical protein
MSSATNRSEEALKGPVRYAPKRLREGMANTATQAERVLNEAERVLSLTGRRTHPAASPTFEGDLAIKQMRSSLEPQWLETPLWDDAGSSRAPSSSRVGLIAKVILAASVATAAAFAYVMIPQGGLGTGRTSSEMAVAALRPAPAAPTPVAEPAQPKTERVDTPVQPDTAPVAPRASEPTPVAEPAQPVDTAALEQPPSPAQEAALPSPTPEAVAPAPADIAAPAEPPPAVVHLLEPGALENLLRRGESYAKHGDISAARMVLKRAAETGDARATLALGETYDPIVLRRLGAVGVHPEPDQVRYWYEKSAAAGSAEAAKRLNEVSRR